MAPTKTPTIPPPCQIIPSRWRIHLVTRSMKNGTTVGFGCVTLGGNFPIIFRHRIPPFLLRKFYTAFTIPNDWRGNLICGHETRGKPSSSIYNSQRIIVKIYSNYSAILVAIVFHDVCANNICHSRHSHRVEKFQQTNHSNHFRQARIEDYY